MTAGKNGGKGNAAKIARELAAPIVERCGLTLWDVRFEKEGALWLLRVYIDKEGGVTFADCEAVNGPMSDALDEADPIDQSYVLEVSSPGLGRQLLRPEHFAFALEKPVRLRLFRERDGTKDFRGTLASFEKDSFVLDTENGAVTFALSDCTYVRLDDDDDLF